MMNFSKLARGVKNAKKLPEKKSKRFDKEKKIIIFESVFLLTILLVPIIYLQLPAIPE